MVSVAEDGSEDGERGGVGEERAEGDGGGLDGWEVYMGREKRLVHAMLKKFSQHRWEELRCEDFAELHAMHCQSSFCSNSVDSNVAKVVRRRLTNGVVTSTNNLSSGNKHYQLTVQSGHCNRR